jgi:hypothetical protein
VFLLTSEILNDSGVYVVGTKYHINTLILILINLVNWQVLIIGSTVKDVSG